MLFVTIRVASVLVSSLVNHFIKQQLCVFKCSLLNMLEGIATYIRVTVSMIVFSMVRELNVKNIASIPVLLKLLVFSMTGKT